MASKIDRLSDCEHLLNNFKKKRLKPEICGRFLSSNKSNGNYSSITEHLQDLPKIKASKQFDQKMAAAFAMELQKEEQQRNLSLLKKNQQISLPDIISDLGKNFL